MHIAHSSLRIANLLPTHSPAFSPNLYAWMKSHGCFFQDGGVATSVYRATVSTDYFPVGTLLLGFPSPDSTSNGIDFIGEQLSSVLCFGAKRQSMCYLGLSTSGALEEIPDFWNRYLKDGRCAIDPDHSMGFRGDRFRTVGNIRECLWCGVKHQVHTTTVMVPQTITTYEPLSQGEVA